MNPEYHRLAGGPATIWAVPEATHVKAIDVRPAEYERRVVSFFDDALAPTRTSS